MIEWQLPELIFAKELFLVIRHSSKDIGKESSQKQEPVMKFSFLILCSIDELLLNQSKQCSGVIQASVFGAQTILAKLVRYKLY